MATQIFFRLSLFCAIAALLLMFVAFASPFWYKSWTRVHSPFSNVGLWHICLAGYIIPGDPNMKSYVGCWWIHSSEFDGVKTHFMPSWFMGVQALSIFTLIADVIGLVALLMYLPQKIYQKFFSQKRSRVFYVASCFQLISAGLVFLIALVFAQMSLDPYWMPRPWLNYLSWSYGFCVLSGFFNAFGGMFSFVNALIFTDKERAYKENPDRVDSRENREKAKEMEAARERQLAQEMAAQREMESNRVMYRGGAQPYQQQTPPQTKVGESFV